MVEAVHHEQIIHVCTWKILGQSNDDKDADGGLITTLNAWNISTICPAILWITLKLSTEAERDV